MKEKVIEVKAVTQAAAPTKKEARAIDAREKELARLQAELTARREVEGVLAGMRTAAQIQGDIDVALAEVKALKKGKGND